MRSAESAALAYLGGIAAWPESYAPNTPIYVDLRRRSNRKLRKFPSSGPALRRGVAPLSKLASRRQSTRVAHPAGICGDPRAGLGQP